MSEQQQQKDPVMMSLFVPKIELATPRAHVPRVTVQVPATAGPHTHIACPAQCTVAACSTDRQLECSAYALRLLPTVQTVSSQGH